MGPCPSKDGQGRQGRLGRSPHAWFALVGLSLDEPYGRVQELVLFVTPSRTISNLPRMIYGKKCCENIINVALFNSFCLEKCYIHNKF